MTETRVALRTVTIARESDRRKEIEAVAEKCLDTIVRKIAEEESANAYDALYADLLDLQEKVEVIRRDNEAFRLRVLVELNRLRNALG